MTATPAQRAAEERAETAIRELLDAYDLCGNGVLTDYLIIAVQQGFDADGDEETYVSPLLPRPMPLYRMLGMLEHASARVRARITRGDEDEDE